MSMFGQPDEQYLDAMEERINSHIAHEEEMARIDAYLRAERLAILENPAPRSPCPGCFSTIFDGARKLGWCMDCYSERAKYEKQAHGY